MRLQQRSPQIGPGQHVAFAVPACKQLPGPQTLLPHTTSPLTPQMPRVASRQTPPLYGSQHVGPHGMELDPQQSDVAGFAHVEPASQQTLPQHAFPCWQQNLPLQQFEPGGQQPLLPQQTDCWPQQNGSYPGAPAHAVV